MLSFITHTSPDLRYVPMPVICTWLCAHAGESYLVTQYIAWLLITGYIVIILVTDPRKPMHLRAPNYANGVDLLKPGEFYSGRTVMVSKCVHSSTIDMRECLGC